MYSRLLFWALDIKYFLLVCIGKEKLKDNILLLLPRNRKATVDLLIDLS